MKKLLILSTLAVGMLNASAPQEEVSRIDATEQQALNLTLQGLLQSDKLEQASALLNDPRLMKADVIRQTILGKKDMINPLLEMAAKKGHAKTVAFLAQHNLIKPTEALEQLLFVGHQYPQQGLRGAIQALLNNGANPNGQGLLMVPLAAAIAQGHPDVALLLLAHGANPHPDMKGLLPPVVEAEQKGYDKVVERINSAG